MNFTSQQAMMFEALAVSQRHRDTPLSLSIKQGNYKMSKKFKKKSIGFYMPNSSNFV
jgi:hypothetical protein